MSNLVYPHQNLWQFLVNDEPDFDADDWRGPTEVFEAPLESVIADLDDEGFDWRDGDLGGQ